MDQNIDLRITFIEGKDLMAADSNGKSDPYVKVVGPQPNIYNIPKKGFKTHTIKKTLNPVWNETFVFNVNRSANALKFEVYDHDTFGKDDFLGNGTISLEFLAAHQPKSAILQEQTCPLSIPQKDKKTKKETVLMKGNVRVRIQYVPLGYENYDPRDIPPQINVAVDPNFVTPMRIALVPNSWIPINEEEVNVGLGWDFNKGDVFDLDASVSGFDENNNLVENIFYSHKNGLNGSVYHHGDNVTGEGSG